MNKQRRKQLQKALDIVSEVFVEEQEAYDNMPEGLVYSDKGEHMSEGLNILDDTKGILEIIIEDEHD